MLVMKHLLGKSPLLIKNIRLFVETLVKAPSTALGITRL